jgi:hypothetical protein
MTYQHVVVVMSIVVGLSVTQLLKGVAQLYRNRSRVRTYWLHSAWTALTVVFSFLLWWTFWNYRGIADWNFLRFVMYLSPAVVFYFLIAIAIPDPAEAVDDMRKYYFSNRRGFFGTFALYGAVAAITAIIVRGLPLLDPSNLFRLAMVVLLLIAMQSASERVHAVVLGLSASLLVVFISLFHFRLE